MSDAADRIVEALLAVPAGTVPIHGSDVRALCGLSAGAFGGGVRVLRNAGKMAWDSFELSPSMRAVPASAVEALRAEVHAEARDKGRSREAAKSIGTVVRGGGAYLGAGAQVQDMVLSDDVVAVAWTLRTRWSALWSQVCASAARHHERPVRAMVRLIAAGIAAEAAHQESLS